jgi:hypothetical protein
MMTEWTNTELVDDERQPIEHLIERRRKGLFHPEFHFNGHIMAALTELKLDPSLCEEEEGLLSGESGGDITSIVIWHTSIYGTRHVNGIVERGLDPCGGGLDGANWLSGFMEDMISSGTPADMAPTELLSGLSVLNRTDEGKLTAASILAIAHRVRFNDMLKRTVQHLHRRTRNQAAWSGQMGWSTLLLAPDLECVESCDWALEQASLAASRRQRRPPLWQLVFAGGSRRVQCINYDDPTERMLAQRATYANRPPARDLDIVNNFLPATTYASVRSAQDLINRHFNTMSPGSPASPLDELEERLRELRTWLREDEEDTQEIHMLKRQAIRPAAAHPERTMSASPSPNGNETDSRREERNLRNHVPERFGGFVTQPCIMPEFCANHTVDCTMCDAEEKCRVAFRISRQESQNRACADRGVTTVNTAEWVRNFGAPDPPLERTTEPTMEGDKRCINCHGYHPDTRAGTETKWFQCPVQWDLVCQEKSDLYHRTFSSSMSSSIKK